MKGEIIVSLAANVIAGGVPAKMIKAIDSNRYGVDIWKKKLI